MGKVLLLTAVVLALAACGSAKHQGEVKTLASSQQTQAAKAAAEKIAKQCIDQGGGWRKIAHCAVPPHHGVAFVRCVVDHAPRPLSASTIEAVLVTCGERYR